MNLLLVPATSANLGPGFDSIGLALRLYLRVRFVRTRGPLKFLFKGEGAKGVLPGRNLIRESMLHVARLEGCEIPNLRIEVQNSIPVARGLGSSAAAILAGVLILDQVCNLGLSRDKILEYAAKMEGHPDNVAPALLGGFVASALSDDGRIVYCKGKISSRIKAIVVVPDFDLPTEEARRVLPRRYPRQDVVFNLQRTALLVAALGEGKGEVLREAMRDRVHQPYRQPLIPGLSEILSLPPPPGMLGAALSGAGPSVIAFAEDNFPVIGRRIARIFRRNGVSARVLQLDIDNLGARFARR